MNKKFKKVLIGFISLLLIFALYGSFIFAHPGRLDSNGGHFDNSTGEYHYHHGYPAHQHTNGECPYDFDDKTNHNRSNNNSNNSQSSILIPLMIALFFVVLLIYTVYEKIYIKIRTNKRKQQSEKLKKELLPLLNDIKLKQILLQEQYYSIMRKNLNNVKCQYFDFKECISNLNKDKIEILLTCDYFKSFYINFPNLSKELINDFSIYKLANVPSYYYFVDKNLYCKNDIVSFELYKSSTGNRVHLIKGCSGADISINISEVDTNNYFYCKKCFNSKNNQVVYQMLTLGFPKWYDNYMFYYDVEHDFE